MMTTPLALAHSRPCALPPLLEVGRGLSAPQPLTVVVFVAVAVRRVAKDHSLDSSLSPKRVGFIVGGGVAFTDTAYSARARAMDT